MNDSFIKTSKNICTFCQTPIKNEAEELECPTCNSPYHNDCWIENKGCAVYGCGEKIKDIKEESDLREAIINIEYLINRNQFSEAIFEAKQFLKLERRSSELKNLYNKAVSLINNKINLMTSGDEAFNKRDYKAAEIYYKNVLKYADEVESSFVNTRLEISKEKIPEQNRRRVYQNILIVVIIIAILSAIGYLGYYTFILNEDRDYTELVSSDNSKDLKSMEANITKYENFLRSYPNGKNKARAVTRINQYSYQISSIYYKDDWKLALKYYNKISNTLNQDDAKNLKNNIYKTAYNEFAKKISNAKKLNAISKYGESLNELNNSMLIISSFPGTDMGKEKNIVEANIALLNKKLSSIVKVNDLDREIKEKDRQLGGLSSSGIKNTILLSARLNKFVEPNVYIGKETETGNLIAIQSINNDYRTGQLINLECIGRGKFTVSDNNEQKSIPLYIPYFETTDFTENDSSFSERDAINERLKNLRLQKSKLDSLLKAGLM
ncbi:MAG: hypothetical protein ABIY50_01115 [Ignavibacteria bacterium]